MHIGSWTITPPKKWSVPWVLDTITFGHFKSEGNYLMLQAASECLAQLCATFPTHRKNVSPSVLKTCLGVMFGAGAIHTALGTQAGARVANGEAAQEKIRAANEKAIAAKKGNFWQKTFTFNDFFHRTGAQPIAAAIFSAFLGMATAGTYYRGPGEKPVHVVSAVFAQIFTGLYCWSNTSNFREKVGALAEAAEAEAMPTVASLVPQTI